MDKIQNLINVGLRLLPFVFFSKGYEYFSSSLLFSTTVAGMNVNKQEGLYFFKQIFKSSFFLPNFPGATFIP